MIWFLKLLGGDEDLQFKWKVRFEYSEEEFQELGWEGLLERKRDDLSVLQV